MASVKVAVRVRPFNEREISLDSKCIIKMESNKTIILNSKANDISLLNDYQQQSTTTSSSSPSNNTNLLNTQSASMTQLPLGAVTTPIASSSSREKFKEFVYDASYWSFDKNDPNFVSQLDVYNDLGKTTLNSAFDGYNACVCAYGQTGSGKSFSMMGQHDNTDKEGLIPRICKNLFDKIRSKSNLDSQTISYRTEVSYLEIYNEKVRDLLRSSSSQSTQKNQNLKVREHPKTGVYVQDLSQHTVINYEDIEELISRGNVNRTTASTNMNDVSSRSHAIFTIKFSQAKIVENIPSETVSKINLVDLAGSERADSTGATGIRLKEGGNINKSLLTFINVISTLADLSSNSDHQQKKHYIPYRDSVLTWLLKDSLGGNSKTVILAAISPADVNYVETLSTLRYANRAKNIINKPTINEDPNVKLIRELRAEILKLKLLLGDSTISNEINHSNLNDVDQNENSEILKQIDFNQTKIDELTNNWKCRWQKYHSIFDEYESLSIVKNANSGVSLFTSSDPYLICCDLLNNTGLNEDYSKLNCFSLYPLKEGINLINGLKIQEDYSNFELDINTSNQLTDIFLNDKSVFKSHCYLKLDKDSFKVYLKLLNGTCQINDLKYESNQDEPIEINTNDFLFIGDYLFQFKNPNQTTSIQNDFSLNFSHFLKDFFSRVNTDSTDSNSVTQPQNDNNNNDTSLTHTANSNKSQLNELVQTLNDKVRNYELLIEEQRKQIQNMNEQIEFNNSEMSKLKELSLKLSSVSASSSSTTTNQMSPISSKEDINDQSSKHESVNQNQQQSNNHQINNPLNISDSEITIVALKENEKQQELISKELDERETIQNLVEKFEREEKLLSDCMKDLNKSQQNQLKTLLFELQNMRLKEQELDTESKRCKSNLEKSIEKLNEKRDFKLSELNKTREKILQNKQLIDLKLKMSQLTHYEMELEEKINFTETCLAENQNELERLNTQLSIKKMYLDDKQTLNEVMDAENENIRRTKEELEKVKKTKQDNYLIIEKEFELAKEQMINEFETSSNILNIKNEINELVEKETKLKKFLLDCLYENDEEKCLVENELTEIVEQKEALEDHVEEQRTKHRLIVNKQMEQEYLGLEELKKQGLEEIKQDEERIHSLYESSTKYLQDSIHFVNEQIFFKQNELKQLKGDANTQNKKMNQLLAELEVMENKRLIEENKIFLKELQIANEIKNESEKLNNEINKMDLFYRRKLDNYLIKKENLKPKICALVGNYKGIQLYEADFNPKIPVTNASENLSSSRSNSVSLYTDLPKQLNSLFVDTSMNDSYAPSSGTSSETASSSNSPINMDSLVRTVRKEQSDLKFQTNLCKTLGINVEINESYLFGKKSWDEHYEYLIEIRINEENWFVFRRYSKIRQLHEQMCLLYPSLNRIVFPMRWLFNGMDKNRLLERQLQLEHYLKCFLEILINDPTCPIYFGSLQQDKNYQSNSNVVMSNSISLNSLNSSIYSSPSSLSQNSMNLMNMLTRAKLSSFCPFFEQTQQDLIYSSKINYSRVSYRAHSSTLSSSNIGNQSSNSSSFNLTQDLS